MNPYNYQIEAINWMKERETDSLFKGGILADEVGLGKTIMTTEIILQNPQMNTLIIVPKSLQLQWKKEMEMYILNKEYNVKITIPEKDSLVMNKDENIINIVIVSQSRFNNRGITDITKLSYCIHEWDRVIIDEAHIIKNKKSKIHKAVSILNSPIRWALTATPIMNKMSDFVHTMGWVSQNQLSQLDCQTTIDSIVKTYIMRRTKEDIKDDNLQFELPKCHISVDKLHFSSESEKKMYIEKYNEMYEKIKEMKKILGNQNTMYALELLLRARQICSHPQCYIDGMKKKEKKKIKELGENAKYLDKQDLSDWEAGCTTKLLHTKQLLSQNPKSDKTLIFCHFIKEMDIYKSELEKEGYSVCRIDGRIDIEDRNIIVEKFKSDPTVNIMIIQINVGGQGFNFQCANRIVITSPTWNPALQHQVIGRCHRTGQKKEVHVNILTISNEDIRYPYVEEYIMELQRKKRELMAEVLNDPRLKELDSTLSFSEVSNMFQNKLTL